MGPRCESNAKFIVQNRPSFEARGTMDCSSSRNPINTLGSLTVSNYKIFKIIEGKVKYSK